MQILTINAAIPIFKTSPSFGQNFLWHSDNSFEDTFEPRINIDSNTDFTENDCRRIINTVKRSKSVGNGANAKFFNLGSFGVKIQSNYDDLKREQAALLYLEKSGVQNIPRVKGLFGFKDNGYLVMEKLKGTNPNSNNNKFSNKTISSLLDVIFSLDKSLLTHYDLHSGNILLDGDKASILDFGTYNFVDEDGIVRDSREKTPDKYFETISMEYKLARLFEHSVENGIGTNYQWNYIDNPDLPLCSNLVNFEFRGLSNYMQNYERISPVEANDFYVDYLKQKSEYCLKRAVAFSPVIDKISIPEAQEKLKNGIKYEMAIAEVLKNPNKNIIEVEKAKMYLKSGLFDQIFSSERDFDEIQRIKTLHENMIAKLKEIQAEATSKSEVLYAESQLKLYDNGFWEMYF